MGLNDLSEKIHEAQLLSYLELSGRRVGLRINFNVKLLESGIRRLVNELPGVNLGVLSELCELCEPCGESLPVQGVWQLVSISVSNSTNHEQAASAAGPKPVPRRSTHSHAPELSLSGSDHTLRGVLVVEAPQRSPATGAWRIAPQTLQGKPKKGTRITAGQRAPHRPGAV